MQEVVLTQAVGLKLTSQEVKSTDRRKGGQGRGVLRLSRGAFWGLGAVGPWASGPVVALSPARQVWATCTPRGSWPWLQSAQKSDDMRWPDRP